MSRDALTQIPRWCDRTRVVNARSSIESRGIACPSLVETLRQAVTRGCSTSTLLNHLRNRARGARVLHDYFAGVVAPAGGAAIMVLHEARVGDAAEGGGDADAAAGFLEDDGEDEAVINEGARGDGFDGVVDGGDFGWGVVGKAELVAGLLEDELAGIEPVFRLRYARVTEKWSETDISMNETQLVLAGHPAAIDPSPLYCL